MVPLSLNHFQKGQEAWQQYKIEAGIVFNLKLHIEQKYTSSILILTLAQKKQFSYVILLHTHLCVGLNKYLIK